MLRVEEESSPSQWCHRQFHRSTVGEDCSQENFECTFDGKAQMKVKETLNVHLTVNRWRLQTKSFECTFDGILKAHQPLEGQGTRIAVVNEENQTFSTR
mmetsp:Transcript_27073/g.58732  ORF Transcript_27073/g.58732 Transcript_27073/m.58732 type:complete len:99 (+) Transcript_27073:249-545(+)